MPFKSKAQQRFMFAAEERGELPKGTAHRWAEHTPDIKHLPERKKKKKKDHHDKHAFVTGFDKVAVVDLSEEARYKAIAPMQDYVPGRVGNQLDTDTGQRRKANMRTQNVRGEDREFTQALKHDVVNARRPK